MYEPRKPDDQQYVAGAAETGVMRSSIMVAAVLTMAGFVLPMLFLEMAPSRYVAETRLRVDGAEAAYVAAMAEQLRSKTSLDNVIRALNLGRSTEFAIDRPSVVQVVTDIVSGDETTVSEAEAGLRARLSRAITVRRDAATGQVAISVDAADSATATRIANILSRSFADDITLASAQRADPLVEKLRRTAEQADAALSGFLAGADAQKIDEVRRRERASRELAAEVGEAEQQLADTRQKSALASSMKLADVLGKPLPDSLEFTSLDYQRQRYVDAKLAVDQLSADLGPRHPRLLAAQAALDRAASDIQATLKQLVASLRQAETTAARHLADLRTQQAKVPDDKEIANAAARLASLQEAVDEARRNYEEAQQRSSAAPLPAARVAVVRPVTVDAVGTGSDAVLEISAGGGLFGLMLGGAFVYFRRRRGADTYHDLPTRRDDVHANLGQVWADAATDDIAEMLAEPLPVEVVHDAPGHEPETVQLKSPEIAADEPAPTRPQRYPMPANDSAEEDLRPEEVSLGDHLRERLLANRAPADLAFLPPLLRQAMEASTGGVTISQPVYGPSRASREAEEATRKQDDMRELRRNMAELRERVELYAVRRNGSQH